MEDTYGSGLRVLVVDDEASIRLLLREILEAEGFVVDAVASVQEARDAGTSNHPDILVVDKNLPDGTGFDVMEQLSDAALDSATIMISAYGNMDSIIEAMRRGIFDYLTKPFENPQYILERVRAAVEHLGDRKQIRMLVEELQEKNKALEALATRDALTGLHNHAYFQERLTHEISRSKRYQHTLGIMFIDVDNFKQINDSVGHPGGDSVLQTIADILRGRSRETDFHFRLRKHDIAARYGGDEFVLMLPETPKAGTATTAERLRRCVEETEFSPELSGVTLSIGVAGFPEDGDSRDSVIGAADAALYAAKNSGRNRVIAYTSDIAASDSRSSWEDHIDVRRLDALKRSIDIRAFRFVYQPIIEAASRRIVGYEALCRPTDQGLTNPTELLRAAEHAGKMLELGRALRELAVAPMRDLPAPLLLFLNLHPQELHDPALVALEPYLQPWVRRLVLEVNNSRGIDDQQRLRRTLTALKANGFKIALDDLCSGYMGLNSLTRLEPDFVKMDVRSLRDVRAHERAMRVIRHFLEYTAGESISVVGVGIENEELHQLALSLGFPLVQGFYYAEGLPAFTAIPRLSR